MRNIRFIAVIIMGAFIGTYSAISYSDITYKKYVLLKEMKAAGNSKHGYGALLLDHWLDGVAEGLYWPYLIAEKEGEKSTFACFPPNLAITKEIVFSTIEAYLKQDPVLKEDDTPMGWVAAVSLREAFPCEEKP